MYVAIFSVLKHLPFQEKGHSEAQEMYCEKRVFMKRSKIEVSDI